MQKHSLSPTAEANLRMFGPQTHSIQLPRGDYRDELEQAGLIKWVPSWMPGGNDYGLTDEGRKWLGL